MGITGWRYHHSKSAVELNGMRCLVIEVASLWRALPDSFETPPTRPRLRFANSVFSPYLTYFPNVCQIVM